MKKGIEIWVGIRLGRIEPLIAMLDDVGVRS